MESRSSLARTSGASPARWRLLFAASTWPIHQIGEDYLYSVHMLQHMMLSYFMPPLVLLATPTWLMRLLVGTGRTYRSRQVHDQAGGRRRRVQRGGDGHPHPAGRQRLGAERTAALLAAPGAGAHRVVDVDARRRAVPRTAHQRRRQADLPVPAERRAHGAGRLADVCRGSGLQALRPAGAGVEPQPDRRPATGRGDHEDRRFDLPVVARRLLLLQALRDDVEGRQHLSPAAADLRSGEVGVRQQPGAP